MLIELAALVPPLLSIKARKLGKRGESPSHLSLRPTLPERGTSMHAVAKCHWLIENLDPPHEAGSHIEKSSPSKLGN